METRTTSVEGHTGEFDVRIGAGEATLRDFGVVIGTPLGDLTTLREHLDVSVPNPV